MSEAEYVEEAEDLTPDADEMDAVWEDPTRTSEYIAAAYNAILAVQEVDMTLLGKQYEAMRARVVKKCLRIVNRAINDLYDEMFVVNAEEE